MKRYLAIDLGAESGRAIAGQLDGGKISLEVLHRFPNGPVLLHETLVWDQPGLQREIRAGLAAYGARFGRDLRSLGADTWGVDFGLLDRRGALLANPVHYRDARTDGAPEEVFRTVPRAEVYRQTGIQIMQLNTLYQLHAVARKSPWLLEQADSLLLMADLQAYFLCGEKTAEYTLASTTQMLDPVRREWAGDLLSRLGLPTGLLPEVIAPGSVVGTLREAIAQECGVRQAPVIAPAGHDTAAAVAAVPAQGDDWLYLSSGTWSLLGAELPAPLINDGTFGANFTNEGGVDGTIRFLKNIMGLWLVQECKRAWERQGTVLDYAEITRFASEAKPFRALIDPSDPVFFQPGDMPARIVEVCRKSGQTPPQTQGEIIRTALESLALVYRQTIEEIERLTGRRFRTLHIVGGGSQNRLLNRFAADATGRVVKAGPVEATALGNCLMQAIALGDLGSLAEAREVVRQSVELETYEPAADRNAWNEAYDRFRKMAK